MRVIIKRQHNQDVIEAARVHELEHADRLVLYDKNEEKIAVYRLSAIDGWVMENREKES